MHWPSYLLGLLTLPALLAFFLLARGIINRVRSGRGRGLGELSLPSAQPREPTALEFTPRLVGQIRERIEPGEDSAQAS
ncbi:MAG: hypothetical protein V3R89_01190 [Thermoanaerobaculia bacterium]